ncbi:MAG TPA: hypothetical protein PKW66_21390 [Polyangiaceae bacterium]|nr:hypothetical protein [Polyangiaceae bacterium]
MREKRLRRADGRIYVARWRVQAPEGKYRRVGGSMVIRPEPYAVDESAIAVYSSNLLDRRQILFAARIRHQLGTCLIRVF